MEFIAEVADHLRQYCRGQLSTLEANRLIKLAASIAQQKLWGRLWAASRAQETSIRQEALSVVAGLFHGGGKDSPLGTAVEDDLKSDDGTLFLRFQAVVIRAASQELFHRWSENDPLGARLWRNLHRALRYDSRIVIFPGDKPMWASLTTSTDLREHLPQLCHEEVVKIISELNNRGEGIGNLIVAALSRVANDSNCQNALQIEILFSALRETKIRELAGEVAAGRYKRDRDPQLHIAIEKASKAAHHKVGAKLDRYRAMEKLQPDTVEYFRCALSDLIADCTDGGPAQSYYQYLHSRWSSLTRENYRKIFRARFEYLAEAVQKVFFEKIREQYCI